MARETRTVHVKVTSNVSSIGKETSKATAQAGGLKGALKGVGAAAVVATGGIRAMVAALMSSGIGAIVVALGSLTAILGSTLRESMNFSKELSGLQAILDADKDAMGDFSKEAKRLGATTAFTASQVVELQTEFAKLGFTKDEIINVTEATLSLAAASGTDLANAAMVAGATLRGLGLDSSQTARVADVMADSFTKSGLNITFFQESMKLVAPTAANLKVSLERSTAALSILADAGIKGSMAGTNLRKVMSELSLKTGKGFRESLTLTKEKMDALTSDTEKMALAKELVGQRSKDTLSILIKNIDQLDRLEESYNGATGAAERMAKVQLDNLSGDVTILKSAWSGLLLSFEDGEGGLNKLARVGVQSLTNSLNAASEAANFLGYTMDYYFGKDKTDFESNMTSKTATIGLVYSKFNQFAARVKLLFAKVPFFGRMFDEEKIKEDLKKANAMIAFASMKIKQNQEETAKKGGFWAEWEEKKKRMEFKKTQSLKSAGDGEFVEGESSGSEDGVSQEKAKREKFLNALNKAEEDLQDTNDNEKIERRKQRHLAELEEIKATEEEKIELRNRIEEHYENVKEQKQKEKDDKEKERKEKDAEKIQERLENEAMSKLEKIDAEEQERLAAIEGLENFEDLKTKIVDNAEEKRKKIIKETAEAKRSIELNAAQSLMGALSSVMGKQTKAAKIFGAAQATVSTYSGITKALNDETIPSTFARIAMAASVAVKGFAAVRGIMSTNENGVQGSTPSSGSVTTQAPSFNVVGQQSAGEQAIGSRLDALAGGALKAYVVESEVTNAQQLNNQVENTASLG